MFVGTRYVSKVPYVCTYLPTVPYVSLADLKNYAVPGNKKKVGTVHKYGTCLLKSLTIPYCFLFNRFFGIFLVLDSPIYLPSKHILQWYGTYLVTSGTDTGASLALAVWCPNPSLM